MTKRLSDQELLGRLVAFDTTSHRPPQGLFDFLEEYLAHPALRVERMDCGDGFENMLVECGPPAHDGDGWLLSGHVDTVPAGEPDWETDPWTLVERDGRLYGRGACDMKAFNAIAANLLRDRAEAGFDRPLALLLTHSEEVGTVGAGHFVRDWDAARPLPRRVVVGEPTSLRPVRGHKGHLKLRFAVVGRPCHTGFPAQGVNAIEGTLPLLQCLASLRASLIEERTEDSSLFPEVPHPVLTIAGIDGGSAINVMPERCEVLVGIRLLPGQCSDAILGRLRDALDAAGVRLSERPEEGACTMELLNETPAFSTPPDDAFLREVCRVSGHAEAKGVNYGTDAGRLGLIDRRSVIFGPGDIARAHQANEWMPIDEFKRMPVLLGALLDGSN